MKTEITLKPVKVVKLFEILNAVPDNLDKIRARELWEETDPGSGSVVAVLDSGVQVDHPSLKDNVMDGYNFTDDDEGNPIIYQDYLGHGTHVAGIIAAIDNGRGITGVAPKSKLLILKVINHKGRGSFENLIKAIMYAVAWTGPNGEKVNIMNMSLGSPEAHEELYKAIKYARSKGILLVAAAGNDGDGESGTIEISYPGFYKEVVQVGSISETETPSKFSNTNVNLDFVGPGENILSAHLNSNYVELTGTSMAAPFVAGAAALIIKMVNRSKPHLIPMYVYEYLLSHSLPLENFSINQVGNGFIQLK
ncbi:S8 family peptidase [Lysinibacillus xylanilyticus]|uniref:S8 family peptidase n=1 Tax=Lysinibacillus xylanilyticus TaxID=582475 RepID=UPI0037F4A76D